jgi:hypothetical protein
MVRSLKRELSNARIVATGLEIMPIQWLIGAKYYDPEKIRVFLESMWVRIKSLEKCDQLYVRNDRAKKIVDYALETTSLLRRIKNGVDQKRDTINQAKETLDLLHKYTMAFFDVYFGTMSRARQH